MRFLCSLFLILFAGCTTHPTNLEYQAAAKGDLHALDRVSDSDINRPNKNGTTLLMVAARNGNLASVQNLLKRGANPRARDHDGQSVLHYAVAAKNKLVLSELLRAGADPDVSDRFDFKPSDDETLREILDRK